MASSLDDLLRTEGRYLQPGRAVAVVLAGGQGHQRGGPGRLPLIPGVRGGRLARLSQLSGAWLALQRMLKALDAQA